MTDQKQILDTAELTPNWDAVRTLARRVAELERRAGVNLGQAERAAAAEAAEQQRKQEAAERAARRERRETARLAREVAAAQAVLRRAGVPVEAPAAATLPTAPEKAEPVADLELGDEEKRASSGSRRSRRVDSGGGATEQQ